MPKYSHMRKLNHGYVVLNHWLTFSSQISKDPSQIFVGPHSVSEQTGVTRLSWDLGVFCVLQTTHGSTQQRLLRISTCWLVNASQSFPGVVIAVLDTHQACQSHSTAKGHSPFGLSCPTGPAGKTATKAQLPTNPSISSSAAYLSELTSGSMALHSNNSTGSGSLLGGRRGSQAARHAAQPHLPGSVRWCQWADQLQLLGLTQEEADTALSLVRPVLKQAPIHTNKELKSFAIALLQDTSLTAEQLKQIAMCCPDILKMTRSDQVVGNLRWFRNVLGVTTDEWVQLVCKFRPLFQLHERSLQQMMEELLVVGFDQGGVKACWLQTPGLLKLRPGALLDKVAVLQALFRGISVLEVMLTDPSALLHPTRNLRDRVLFLRKLDGEGVSLANIQHVLSDAEFALQVVGLHLAGSGKSLPQLCSELQAQPRVAAFMKKIKVDPATMDEHKYYQVAVIFARPGREASADGSVWGSGLS